LQYLNNLHGEMQVTDAGLEALVAALPQLTALNLKYIYRITDAGIATVARLTALEALNVTKCKYETAERGSL